MQNTKNHCHFEGRISRDPIFSQVQIGNDMVNKAIFSVAVDRALTKAQKDNAKANNKPTADFISFSCLGPSADLIRNYFPKGKAISVDAHYTSYQTQDRQTGQTKYEHIFEVEKIDFTVQDAKNIAQDQGQNNGGYQQSQQGYNNGYQQQNQQQNYQQPQQNYQQQNSQQQNGQQQPANNNPNNGFSLWDDNANPFF